MTNAELSDYIEHYLNEDKTQSAIMLTGNWGSGKSYFIKNTLIPNLENKHYRCICISLYSISSLIELSNTLFLHVCTQKTKKIDSKIKKIIFSSGSFVIQTAAQTLSNKNNISIANPQKLLKSISDMVDLKDKLIILEDLERANIDIIELMGYINNLVENNNAKILLVANEKEIIKDRKDNYLRIKEKTVSDTIIFENDIKGAIKNIISGFKGTYLSEFTKEKYIDDIYNFFNKRNFRTFIYACQKTINIIKEIVDKKIPVDLDTKQSIFYSIIMFSEKIKSNTFPEWDGNKFLSTRLGSKKYPLYRFCYDYIRWHEFYLDEFYETIQSHKTLKLYDKEGGNSNDADLNVLYMYYINPEKVVLQAIDNIDRKLNEGMDISFYDYGKIAYNLVGCHLALGYDYNNIKETMKSNIKKYGKNKNIDGQMLFLIYEQIPSEENDTYKELFTEFKYEILDAIKESNEPSNKFDYDPKSIDSYYNHIVDNISTITRNHKFISDFDIDKLISCIFDCNPGELDEFRGILFAVYRYADKSSFVNDDCIFMKKLLDKLKNNKNVSEDTDKILLLQIEYLCSNLETFIKQLE